MKYRIIENGHGRHRVQLKRWLWWSDVGQYVSLGGLTEYIVKYFDSLEETKNYLHLLIEFKAEQKKKDVIVYEIDTQKE